VRMSGLECIGTGECNRRKIGGTRAEIEPLLELSSLHFHQRTLCRRREFHREIRLGIIAGHPF